MSNRMTDERLAQLKSALETYRFKPSENMTTDVEWELLEALKADREYVKELEDEMPSIAGAVGASMYGKRISELEAQVRDYESILYRNGFEPCSVSECNCGSWHQVRGWPLLQRITRMADRIRELEAHCDELQRGKDEQFERVRELEAELYEERAADRAARLTIVDDLNQLQHKYDALVEKGRHIIANYDEWDDVLPNECIDRFRALLEIDDD